MLSPGNVKPYDKLWAVLSVDPKGNEGICAINTPIGPQVAITGEKRVLEFYLAEVAKGRDEVPSNMKIVVAEFERRETKAVL